MLQLDWVVNAFGQPDEAPSITSRHAMPMPVLTGLTTDQQTDSLRLLGPVNAICFALLQAPPIFMLGFYFGIPYGLLCLATSMGSVGHKGGTEPFGPGQVLRRHGCHAPANAASRTHRCHAMRNITDLMVRKQMILYDSGHLILLSRLGLPDRLRAPTANPTASQQN